MAFNLADAVPPIIGAALVKICCGTVVSAPVEVPETLNGLAGLKGPPEVCVTLIAWMPNPSLTLARSPLKAPIVCPSRILIRPLDWPETYTLPPATALVVRLSVISLALVVTTPGNKPENDVLLGDSEKVSEGVTVEALAAAP